ncbi:zinc finger BED domain-containing protein isoform X5 [Gambusia affinis]|uniref:zinc finger BED domain-containing protein isoform X5 n=1 Tax=Gambusia affinis TaxID=33528 RepID=UPI001CDB76E0|nr:zinc finger BED domain-containing protein isoform X5 [Gambusia affinis]
MGPRKVYRGMERDHEAAASHDHQHMEIDDEQIISVVVSVDDDESNTRTTQNNSDPSTAVSGLCETSPRGSLAHLIHEDDLSHIPNKQSRRRSLIWRLFEHLDNLNAARCRICMKKLHKSGGISNLRRHLVKRHPKVLSELLSTNHRPAVPSQDVNAAGVSRESYIGTEPHPVKLVLDDGESHIMTTLNEPDIPAINKLPGIPQGESAEKIIEAEDSNGDGTGGTMWDSGQKWFPVRSSFPSAGLKISRQPEVEVRVFERELELIEALRRTQREEAQALQQQRELLERLQTVGAREAAADRETIESLRKAQQEEADELIRQKEELEKEKAELRKKWEELYQEKEEFSLLSKSKATH